MTDLRPEDPLARFLTQKDQYARTKNAVKWRAFMPRYNADAQRDETSVFRVDGLDDGEIWELGAAILGPGSPKSLHGRAEIQVSAVGRVHVDLVTELDNVPLRHANIVGWSQEKSEQEQMAHGLAAEAVLKLLT